MCFTSVLMLALRVKFINCNLQAGQAVNVISAPVLLMLSAFFLPIFLAISGKYTW